jgi:hypothetical protein
LILEVVVVVVVVVVGGGGVCVFWCCLLLAAINGVCFNIFMQRVVAKLTAGLNGCSKRGRVSQTRYDVPPARLSGTQRPMFDSKDDLTELEMEFALDVLNTDG